MGFGYERNILLTKQVLTKGKKIFTKSTQIFTIIKKKICNAENNTACKEIFLSNKKNIRYHILMFINRTLKYLNVN